MNQLELFPTTEPSPQTSAPSRAGTSLYKPTQGSNSSVFDQFTDDQLFQIVDWLADHTYKQTRGLIKDNYHRDISYGAIQRFFERTSFLDCLDQSEPSAAAAREILRNTVSNQVEYSKATLRILEQTAFNLALTSRTRPHDLDPLNRINNIICRSRNTAVRERHATVQEKKVDLRTRELDLKHQILHARLNPNRNPNIKFQSRDAFDYNAAKVGAAFLSGPRSRPAITSITAIPSNQNASPHSVPDNSTRPTIRILIDEDGEAFTRIQTPCPLPDEVVIENRAYAKKLLAGLVDSVTGEEPPAPSFNGGTSRARSAEQLSVLESESPTSTSRNAITSNNATPSDLNANIFHLGNPVHPVENPQTKNSTLNTQNSNTSSSSFLSPEVLANTRLYDQKVACGEIRHIFTPGKHYEIEYCNPADKPALERLNKSAPLHFIEDPTRTHYLPGLRTFGKNPYIPPAAKVGAAVLSGPLSRDTLTSNNATPSDQTAQISNPGNLVKPVENPPTQNSKLNIQTSADLAAAVDHYNNLRAQEYFAHQKRRSEHPAHDPNPFPQYTTQYRYCPCANACPCPIHEDEENFGRYFSYFWTLSPFHSLYVQALRERGLPYTRPKEELL